MTQTQRQNRLTELGRQIQMLSESVTQNHENWSDNERRHHALRLRGLNSTWTRLAEDK